MVHDSTRADRPKHRFAPGREARTLSATHKPVLHGRHWVAITGKPLGATAGAKMFERGGNAIDAACAMLAAVCTMYDDVSWGGETQALIYDPRTKGRRHQCAGRRSDRRHAGVFPAAKASISAHRRATGRRDPRQSRRADDHAGGIRHVVAQGSARASHGDGGWLSDRSRVGRQNRTRRRQHEQWPYSSNVFFPHSGPEPGSPQAGEILRQPDLPATLQKLVEAEAEA